VRRRLGGIRVATHPLPLLQGLPDEVLGDSENLMLAEDLLEPAGVTRTGDYPEKTTHCGPASASASSILRCPWP